MALDVRLLCPVFGTVDNLFFFGTVSAPPKLVIVSNRMGNIQTEGGYLISGMFYPYLPEQWYIK